MPGYVNSKYEEQIDFLDDDTGAAIDVSSYGFGMEWFRHGESTATFTLTEGSGIDVTNAATGSIVISYTPAQGTSLGAGMARVILYQNYSNSSTRTVLAEGSEAIEGKRFDA